MSRSKSALQHHEDWTNLLGRRLSEARLERGESLAAVSAATGVSSSFLSLLERGGTDVSLGRLFPVLAHYGLALEDVLSVGPQPEDLVVRRGQQAVVFSVADGIDVYLAAPDRKHRFTPFVVEYRAGSKMVEWSQHEGEEFVFVLQGALRVELTDADPLRLEVGDSMFFSSTRPHRISPAGRGAARALVVSTEREGWSRSD